MFVAAYATQAVMAFYRLALNAPGHAVVVTARPAQPLCPPKLHGVESVKGILSINNKLRGC